MAGAKRARTVPLPTEAELEVLGVLWGRGASTVREVYDALSGSKDVGYTTVLKQMQVMFEKGLLGRSERFRSHVYSAAAKREDTQQRLAGNLLERAFAGSARDLVLGALGAKKVSAEELREIRKVLDEFERERSGRDRSGRERQGRERQDKERQGKGE